MTEEESSKLVNTINATEHAIRNMSAREINKILRMTGCRPEKKPISKSKAVIIQVSPVSVTPALRALRDQNIICLCEKYKHDGKITILKEDLKSADQILKVEKIHYERVS